MTDLGEELANKIENLTLIPATRNGISRLQEYCVAQSMGLPIYLDLGNDRPDKLFKFQCDAAGIRCEASGSTKKKAKLASANMVFTQLIDKCNEERLSNGLDVIDATETSVGLITSTTSPANITNDNNFIGILHEYCSKKRFQQPLFGEVVGDAVSKFEFVISCTITQPIQLTLNGCGKTKAMAKKESARMVYEYLLENGQINSHSSSSTGFINSCAQESSAQATLSKMYFFVELEDVTLNEGIINFAKRCIDGEAKLCIDSLEVIAKMANCRVEYKPFLRLKDDGNFRCLCQLLYAKESMMEVPVITSYGLSTVDVEHARQNAARKTILLTESLMINR